MDHLHHEGKVPQETFLKLIGIERKGGLRIAGELWMIIIKMLPKAVGYGN